MKIRKKILIPMIVLTVACSAAVLLSSILLFNKELNQATHEKLNFAVTTIENEINTFKSITYMAAIAMTENGELREAILRKDHDDILAIAENLRKISDVDFCTIIDAGGIVLARTIMPGSQGDDLSHLATVKAAKEGNAKTIIERGPVMIISTLTVAPVFGENGAVEGIVSLGFRMDTPEFANSLKKLTGCEVTVYLEDEWLATTLEFADGTSAAEMKAPPEVSDKVLAGKTHEGNVSILGKNMMARYFPLYGSSGEIIGMLSVGEYTAEDTQKIVSNIISGVLITLVVLLVGIIVATYISRTLERRLEDMVEKVREADERTQLLLDATPLCVTLWDSDFQNIIATNEESLKLFDLSSKQEFLDSFYALSPEFQPDGARSRDIIDANNVKAFHDGYIRFELMHRKLNGEPVPCEITLVRVKYKDGYVLAGYTRDLRREKEMISKIEDMAIKQGEIIAAKELAEQNDHFKSIFLANMSHEIRTPMNAILGMAEIQMHNQALPEDAVEAMGLIYDSGNLLTNIINDILDFSKIEAGKLEIVPVKYDIPSLINDTVQLTLLWYESKPIDFKLLLDENTPLDLFGDELRIKQILNNMLSNAFKYTDKGTVELSVSAEQKAKSRGITLILQVSDTGQGMTEDQVNKLFDEYARFNMQTNRPIAGVGLGMSITKRLVDMMGGVISVESEQGKGTIFTVRLPQERSGSAICGAELAEKMQELRFQGIQKTQKTSFIREYMPYGKVLVVDDVSSNLHVAKGLLLPYGMDVETAGSGFEAIEKISSGNEYDIMFMDHMMPVMDGIETVKRIRDMGYARSIVALTANAVTGQVEMFMANGFDGFLSKPIDSREMNLILNKMIRDKQPPEVVEAARQEKNGTPALVSTMDRPPVTIEIAKAFVEDAQNAVTVMETALAKINANDTSDIQSYTTSVHGMKSGLAIVGETTLSGIASRLEKAGWDKDTDVISSETPAFLNALKAAIITYKPPEETGPAEVTDEDIVYLREKLSIIKEACFALDRKAAKAALAELRGKAWPKRLQDVLDNISENLLQSLFENVIDIVENTFLSLE